MKRTPSRALKVLRSAQGSLKTLHASMGALKKAAELILESEGDVVITGIGKSGFIGQKIAATMTSLGRRAYFLHPVEAIHGDIGVLSRGDVLIAISFSGESKEVAKITAYSKNNFSIPVIAITNNKHSTLGKMADVVVGVGIKEEGSPNNLAPMASTTATLVLGDMLAAMLISKDFKKESFARLHPGGTLGLRLKKVNELMEKGNAIPKVRQQDAFYIVVKEINRKRLGVTAVLDDRGRLVGVITDGDIRRFVLKTRDLDKAKASDLMTKKPKVVHEGDSLESVLATMEGHKITSMFVVDKKNNLKGVIHIHMILEGVV